MTSHIISAAARAVAGIGSGIAVAFALLQAYVFLVIGFGILCAIASVTRSVITG